MRDVTKYDPEQEIDLITIKNGQKSEEEFQQFSGVIEKFDYLVDLGINAIGLLPILGSEGKDHDWGYLPQHFFSLKSTYGSINQFKSLIDQCHRRNIRVFNHSDEESPFALIDQNYWESEDKQLNVKPAVKFVSDVIQYWIEQFHIDGVRFDAAKQMDNSDILRKFDSIGHSIRHPQSFFSQAEYVSEKSDLLKENGGPVDTCWSTSFHEDAFIRMKTAATFLLTSVGIPIIWQGEEFGESRELGTDQIQKKSFPMQWNLLENDFNSRLLNIFQSLIKLRRSDLSLQEESINFFYEDQNNRILCYSRGSNLVIITNFDDKPKINNVIPKFPRQGKWIDYLTNEQVYVDEVNNLTLTFLPFDSILYIKPTFISLLERFI